MATLYQIPSPVFSENWMFIETEPKLVYHLNEIIRKELIGDFTLCILFFIKHQSIPYLQPAIQC